MTDIDLPNINQTGDNDWSDVEENDQAIVDVVNGNLTNSNIDAAANIALSKLHQGSSGALTLTGTASSLTTQTDTISGDFTVQTSATDVGVSITLADAGTYMAWATFDFNCTASDPASGTKGVGSLLINGVAQLPTAQTLPLNTAGPRMTVTQVYRFTTAGTSQVAKLRALRDDSGTGLTLKLTAFHTQLFTLRVA